MYIVYALLSSRCFICLCFFFMVRVLSPSYSFVFFLMIRRPPRSTLVARRQRQMCIRDSTAADAKQVRIDVQLLPDDLLVHADAEKSSWALINLLSNAVRHSPPQSTISLTCKIQGNTVLLSVSDQGPGLTDEQHAHLFERFNPHATSGSGLGLSIARDFMRAMNGEISLSATSEKGSVFTIRFECASTG